MIGKRQTGLRGKPESQATDPNLEGLWRNY